MQRVSILAQKTGQITSRILPQEIKKLITRENSTTQFEKDHQAW